MKRGSGERPEPRDSRGALDNLRSWAAAAAIRGLMDIFGSTYRIRYLEGGDPLARLAAERRPVILAYWHEREFLCSALLLRTLVRRRVPLSVLASRSRDGEIVAKLCRLVGVRVVRGSSSRGGGSAVHALRHTVTRLGCSPILTPDGPRGPAHRFKAGGVVLACAARVPVVPLAFACRRPWRLGSWDRLIIPKPFSKVVVSVGAPQIVPSKLSRDDRERERRRLEEVMLKQVAKVEAALEGGAGER